MNTAMALAAEVYATRFGFAVFPCRPSGKTPMTPRGVKDATRDLGQIRSWWAQWPDANVAVACGQPSDGLFVLDIDSEEGEAWLRAQEARNEAVRTAQVLTGKGAHYYFRTSAALKNRVRFVAGADTRSDGGFVIVPPSMHESGKRYTWEVSARLDEVGVQPLPKWLEEVLSGDVTVAQGAARPAPFWQSLVSHGVGQGERNHAVTQLAGHLLRHFVDGHVVLELVQVWNQARNRPPLDPEEVRRTVESVAGLEAKRRANRV